jgi:hypothetical protein
MTVKRGQTIRHNEPGTLEELTRDQLLAIIDRAGFKVGRSAAHPFLGATERDEWCLWCKDCGRDSGYHWENCPKKNIRSVISEKETKSP